jgi:hypothetical protein
MRCSAGHQRALLWAIEGSRIHPLLIVKVFSGTEATAGGKAAVFGCSVGA